MSAASATLAPLVLSALVMLRAETGNVAFARAVREHLDLDLTAKTGGVAAGKAWRLLCLGPDKWLALSETQSSPAPALRRALQGEHVAILDMRDALLAGRLTGAGVADVLARGCAIDFHPRALERPAVVQTLYRRARVILIADDTAPGVDLLVERSFAPYVWEHLRQDAALTS